MFTPFFATELDLFMSIFWDIILGSKFIMIFNWEKTLFWTNKMFVYLIFIPNYRDIIPKLHTKISYRRTWTSLLLCYVENRRTKWESRIWSNFLTKTTTTKKILVKMFKIEFGIHRRIRWTAYKSVFVQSFCSSFSFFVSMKWRWIGKSWTWCISYDAQWYFLNNFVHKIKIFCKYQKNLKKMLLSKRQNKRETFSNFVAFSKYLDFKSQCCTLSISVLTETFYG